MRTSTTSAREPRERSVDEAISEAVTALWAEQRDDGSWEGRMAPSATFTALGVIALVLADRRGSSGIVDRAVEWLLGDQNPDGGWGDVPASPSTLNTTAHVVAALVLACSKDVAAIERGKQALEDFGGRDAIEDPARATLNVAVRTVLGLAGLYEWRRVPKVPIEVALLPDRRQRQVSIFRPLMYSLGIMHAHVTPRPVILRPITRLAERRAMRYLRDVLDIGGPRGGGFDSPAALGWIIIGLAHVGAGAEITARCTDYLRRLVRPDGSWSGARDLELSGTCYVVEALLEAGCEADPRLLPTGDWIRASQRQVPVRGSGCPAGGWGWSMPSSWPDTEDTARATRLLLRLGGGRHDDRVRAGAAWLRAMQNRDGSWSGFARNRRRLFDAACSLMTTQAMVTLHEMGDRKEVKRAVRWLEREQRPDGSLPSVWFRNSTAGTAWAVSALSDLGRPDLPVTRKALRWLEDNQSPDGGWGDGRGQPTVEETAWGLLAVSRLDPHSRAAAAAAAWLVARQRPDGLWDGSPVCYYNATIAYWCSDMANGFALQALARYRKEASR